MFVLMPDLGVIIDICGLSLSIGMGLWAWGLLIETIYQE